MWFFFIFLLFFPFLQLYPESFRTIVESTIETAAGMPAGNTALGINSSALITLAGETRFLRGVEIEVSAPPVWLSYRGSLVMAVYKDLNLQSAKGTTDIEGVRIAFEPLPAKLQAVYQIPVRQSHGLRTTPYVTVPAGVTLPSSFPILFRLMPVVKGISDELEMMKFNLTVRPIVSDEGAVKLTPRYPPQLRNRPFTLLIDDILIENINEQYFLKEGEHHLVILSEDYRNESRVFVVERAKILDLTIELQDPTPMIIFEGPQNSLIFLDNVSVTQNQPIAVEPGVHEARYRIGDYTVTKTLNIARGKTYRVALTVDLNILETE